MLSSDLIDRIRSRAADPKSRTDALDATPETSFFGGAFKTVRVRLGEPSTDPAALPPPASAEDIATAQAIPIANSPVAVEVPQLIAPIFAPP